MPLPPFKAVSYAAIAPGPRLIVLGAVHGDETCGTRAILRVAAELDAGTIALAAGRLTLVPVTNPLAYSLGRRAGDRNLNRKLSPTTTPRQHEDHVANWLCPLLAEHDVLLDLHSFSAPGVPFVFFGPADNDGDLEPFHHAAKEEALAVRLGVGRAACGWLDTYAAGTLRRRAAAAAHPEAGLDTDPRYGIGTTEYMRSVGGWGVTLECGQHADPAAPEVGHRAILAALAHLGLVDAPEPPARTGMETLQLCDVVDRMAEGDRFATAWRSFDRLGEGELIGHRADGSAVRAPYAGSIVFPNPGAAVGHEWFYLARDSDRLGR